MSFDSNQQAIPVENAKGLTKREFALLEITKALITRGTPGIALSDIPYEAARMVDGLNEQCEVTKAPSRHW